MKLAVVNTDILLIDDAHQRAIPVTRLAAQANISLPSAYTALDIATDSQLKSALQQALPTAPDDAFSPLPDPASYACPVPIPPSFRDAYAFLTHVETCRKARDQDVPPAFFSCPPFYFSNPAAMQGAGVVEIPPYQQEKVDYELELAIVIGKDGKDIPVSEADSYIAGFMLLNDWSARAVQGAREMPMMMGPNKSKDFATSCGPWLVTPDELTSRTTPSPRGNHYHVPLTAAVNGQVLSRGDFDSIHYTFAEIIAHTSLGTTLKRGDIIASGTIGTGCLLELNLTHTVENTWLKDGDEVTLTGESLGQLKSVVKFL